MSRWFTRSRLVLRGHFGPVLELKASDPKAARLVSKEVLDADEALLGEDHSHVALSIVRYEITRALAELPLRALTALSGSPTKIRASNSKVQSKRLPKTRECSGATDCPRPYSSDRPFGVNHSQD